jgi:hypothetical protein
LDLAPKWVGAWVQELESWDSSLFEFYVFLIVSNEEKLVPSAQFYNGAKLFGIGKDICMNHMQLYYIDILLMPKGFENHAWERS